MTRAAQEVRLRLERQRQVMHAGGEVTYRVFVADRWVGWIGDGREWRGWRYGGRRWWACWRQDGDTGARWNTELEFGTRASALAALLDHITRTSRTSSGEPSRETAALALVATGDGPIVGPVEFAGIRFWAAIQLNTPEIARRRLNGHGALRGDGALREHLAAGRAPVVRLLGCLVSEGDPARSLRDASQLAGYSPRSILVGEGADMLAVTVNAALLDQGVIICHRDGRLDVVATPGPALAGHGLDRHELALSEAVYAAWLATGADVERPLSSDRAQAGGAARGSAGAGGGSR